MLGLLHFVLAILVLPFKSKTRLEAETAVLRHQLIVLRRKLGGRIQLSNSDRWFLVQMYCWFPSILQVLTIIRPETLVRWQRVGFRHYWRWKSRSLGGRPQIEAKLRMLIRSMSSDNPLWDAPRIHSELLKLGISHAMKANDEFRRKLQQGSRQLQGEVLELALEDLISQTFPSDLVQPVPKGINGADIMTLAIVSSAEKPRPSRWLDRDGERVIMKVVAGRRNHRYRNSLMGHMTVFAPVWYP